jgi:transposase
VISEKDLQAKYEVTFPLLDEHQRRVVAAADAFALGRGGVSKVARASGLSRTTIHSGLKELDRGTDSSERIRRPGAGRKRIIEQTPNIVKELERLVEPTTRGDPESPLRWTCKSTRQLAEELTKGGYAVSYPTVAELLHKLGYSLQANAKTLEGASHPDRDEQFRYITRQVERYFKNRWPVISVDTKKKELVGEYANKGQEWRKKGDPRKVSGHDFPAGIPKAVPYGIYDIAQDQGWVNVGCDHDTAEFAVESIRRWWMQVGKRAYPRAGKLLICADSGGSNGYRTRLWKREIQELANVAGVDITVCHFPPGTSKWNKVEHRLFSFISMNWRGQPLVSHEVIVNLIGATKTRSGLRVKARLDKKTYPRSVKVTDEELATINLKPHKFHGEWNYTIACNKS